MPTATLTRDEAALDEIRSILKLSEAELADLFGVRRQSLGEWRVKGVPTARRATLGKLRDLARVLSRELLPDHIGEVVRTRDEWLGGRTILQTLTRDGVEPVYGYLHRLFSYTGR